MATILIACGTSYQNCSRDISISLDCFVVTDFFLSNGNDRTAIALVAWRPGQDTRSS